MKTIRNKILPGLMALALALNPIGGAAEDIDIFVGSSGGKAGYPNVLIVLDNTSNWARQSQQWPGGLQQGQAEVRSIKTVLDAIGNKINVGVMEFVTNGTANDDGGFIRFPITEMTPANIALLQAEMDEAFGDINGVDEKRNSNTAYGNLSQDIYNYFAGSNVSENGPNATRSLNPPADQVNVGGYDDKYTNFDTALSKDTSCAKNYVIFIGNPNSSGPSDDDSTSNDELTARSCSTTPIALPLFASSSVLETSTVGETSQCYGSAAACSTAITTSGTTEFKEDTDGDGDTEPVCVVTATTAKGKTSYDGKYMVPNGTGGYKSGCACTTAVEAVASCPDGQFQFTRYQQLSPTQFDSSVCIKAKTGATNNCTSEIDRRQTANDLPSGVGTKCKELVAGIGSTYNATTNPYKYECSCDTSSALVCSGGTPEEVSIKLKYQASDADADDDNYTSACYASTASCNTAECGAGTCLCQAPKSSGAGGCAPGTATYNVTGTNALITNTPTGAYDATGKGAPWHLDEWSRCLNQKGVPVEDGDNQTAAVYTIDVYNKSPNSDHTALLMSAARVGGGKYYSATNEDALINALKQIFSEIQSVNSTFASASLPVSATNRAQNENQVYIGMFRPDQATKPRWFGNLKRYQVVLDSAGTSGSLGDVNGEIATNDQTGFVGECATSWWTSDSPRNTADLTKGYYWDDVPVSPSPSSDCLAMDQTKVFSDLPDGPTVEKGAVAEVLRKGNNPPATDASPTWLPNRIIYTTADAFATSLSTLGTAPALDMTQKFWAYGTDTENENVNLLTTTESRPSIHGDVVHSRPLAMNYGDEIVIFYGANDGMFRAVNAETGKERWAIFPYEFAQAGFVDRLRKNEPLIKYPDTDMTITPTPTPKEYGWDGSVGVYQNESSTVSWIYPTQRRGGQLVYGLNVSNPSSPSIMWKQGCYGGSCTGGFDNMGQSWSVPMTFASAGYTTGIAALFGGGYDTCEDKDDPTPDCASPRGANVYAVNAETGSLLKAFATTRSVASEIALVDADRDGKADYAYVGDTGGNIYRIDMVSFNKDTGVYVPLVSASWTIRKIAYANAVASDGRKFFYPPATLALKKSGRVYLAIGTGDREHPLQANYPFDNVVNRFYVFIDDLSVTSGDVDLNSLINRTVADCDETDISPSSDPPGWFMDLNQYGKGEQTVSSALIVAGQVAFSTNRPIPPADGTCSIALGEARGYWVDLFSSVGGINEDGTCSRSDEFAGGGLPPSPIYASVEVDTPNGTKVVEVCFGCASKGDPPDEGGVGGANCPPGKVSTIIGGTQICRPINAFRKRTYYKIKGVD